METVGPAPKEKSAMGEKANDGQGGGVNISGSVGSVGRDKITGAPSTAALEDTLRPLAEAVRSASVEKQPEARAKLAALKQEAAKGNGADDGVLAKLVDGFVDLVPAAASTVVSAFATPILGGIAGPITKFVLGRIKDD
jgi:hypothetical protein